MTIAAIEWLRDTAFERGLHNYAQWIDEHTAPAVEASDGFVAAEVAAANAQIAELSDQLAAEKAHSAEIEKEMADSTLAWSDIVKALAAKGVTFGADGAVTIAAHERVADLTTQLETEKARANELEERLTAPVEGDINTKENPDG